MESFVFLTNNKEIREKVKAGVVPAGYYDSQDEWAGDRWVTTYRYYESNQQLDDWGNPPAGVFWLDEFTPKDCRVSECGALTIIID